MATDQDELIEILREGKLLGWLDAEDNIIPNVRGGAVEDPDEDEDEDEDESEDEDDEEDEEEVDDDDDDDEVDDDAATISQNQMRRIASKEKKDGRRSGRNSVLKALGIASVEEGLKKLAPAGKSKSKGGSEDEDSGPEQVDPEKIKRLAKLEGRTMRKLVTAGAPDKEKTLEGIMSMLDLEFDELTDDDDITTAVDSLKEEMPALFGTAKRKTKPKGSGEAGGPPARRKKSSEGEGKTLFESRHTIKK